MKTPWLACIRLAAALVLSVAPECSYACMCFANLERQFETAHHVLLARVDSVRLESVPGSADPVVFASLYPVEVYKSSTTTPVEAKESTWWYGSSCRSHVPVLRAQQFYILFLDENGNVTACSGSTLVYPNSTTAQNLMREIRAQIAKRVPGAP